MAVARTVNREPGGIGWPRRKALTGMRLLPSAWISRTWRRPVPQAMIEAIIGAFDDGARFGPGRLRDGLRLE